MDSSTRTRYAVKAMAALAFCASSLWLSRLLWAWLACYSDPSPMGALDVVTGVLLSIFLSLPTLFGLYYGWRGLRRTDVVTTKGLVGSYCFCLAFASPFYLSLRALTLYGLSEKVARDFSLLLLTIASVGVYMLVSRRLLRLLGHPCPSIRQSLPAWSIGLIAYFAWDTASGIADERFPIASGNDGMAFVAFAASMLVAVIVYKLGVWLFVKQKRKAEPGDPSSRPFKLFRDRSF